jgi:hypothetical protein
MPPLPASPISALAIEIVSVILELGIEDFATSQSSRRQPSSRGIHNRNCYLASASLTTRAWTEVAQGLLWRDVMLSDDKIATRWLEAGRICQQRRGLKWRTQTLSLMGNQLFTGSVKEATARELLRECEALHTLVLMSFPILEGDLLLTENLRGERILSSSYRLAS